MIDQRIADGMRDQLAERDARVRDGERQIGWKVGFGAPAAAAALGIDRPLVGFMLESAVLPDGASVPIGGWTTPRVEPEIAAHLARDVAPDASWEDARAAIGGLSAAIELVDVHPPPDHVPAVLAGNIFHRHVLLGPVDTERSTGEGIGGRLLVDGEEVAATDDPSALTGELVEVVRLTAELLGACGDRLRAGQVVITGSVVPPLDVSPGQRIEVEVPPLGGLAVRLT
jgi:2-keto-4-pentenoate hydratase